MSIRDSYKTIDEGKFILLAIVQTRPRGYLLKR